MREEIRATRLARLLFEQVDEGAADELAFGLGIGDAREPGEEGVLGIDVDQRDVVTAAEQTDDLARLARAHQPVIDEHAGQPLADRFVDQHGGDRAVDPARQAANHPSVPDLLADLGDLRVAELGPSSSRPPARRHGARN